MATDPIINQEISELKSRLAWLESEFRKSNRRTAALDQRLELQGRELKTRADRIKLLESSLSATRRQLAPLDQIDGKIKDVHSDLTGLINIAEGRRIASEKEIARLHRAEREAQRREIADIFKQLPAIPRLAKEIESRKAEEARLAKIIGVVRNRFPAFDARLEDIGNSTSYAAESIKQNTRQISTIQTELLDTSKRWEPINTRLEILAQETTRTSSAVGKFATSNEEILAEVRQTVEKSRLSEHTQKQRVDSWERTFDDHFISMEKYHTQWIGYTQQVRQAEETARSLTEWRKQIEQQQHDLTELTRAEINRLKGRWESFQSDNDKFWKTAEIEAEQRWSSANRRQRELQEKLYALDELLEQIDHDKATLWRIQSAQADALKQLPRIWLEEVEKAVQNDPNRRRQPTHSQTPDLE